MRKPRHDGLCFTPGNIEQRQLQAFYFSNNGVDLITQIQPYIGSDLVVTRTASVQFFSGIPDALGKTRLDIHVDILKLHRPDKPAALDVFLNVLKPADDRLAFTCA